MRTFPRSNLRLFLCTILLQLFIQLGYSCIFHPCYLLPHFPLPHFQSYDHVRNVIGKSTHRRCMSCGYFEQKVCLFRLRSDLSLSVNCCMPPVRGAVLSSTLIGSESNAFFQRSKRCGFCAPDLPRFVELLEDADSTLFEKSSPTAVTSSINFYRHFRRIHCIIKVKIVNVTGNENVNSLFIVYFLSTVDRFMSNQDQNDERPIPHIVQYISSAEMLQFLIICIDLICNYLGRLYVAAARSRAPTG